MKTITAVFIIALGLFVAMTGGMKAPVVVEEPEGAPLVAVRPNVLYHELKDRQLHGFELTFHEQLLVDTYEEKPRDGLDLSAIK